MRDVNGNHLCLEWKNLTYTVQESQNNFIFCKSRDVQILKNASGRLKAGDLIAVLGSSGAGKSTLLAAISQRLRGNLGGEVLLNGMKVEREQIIRISGFLPQFEINIRTFTAYEHLYFMSHFKMHRNTTKAEKQQRVNELLLVVGLRDAAHTRIQQLSGGERKRLSLAEELITDPPFLFCDEPTTGLDSYNAYTVIKTLRHLCTQRRVANNTLSMLYGEDTMPSLKSNSFEMQIQESLRGYSVLDSATSMSTARQKTAAICTIHQPTSDIFELFTHIIIMDKGQILYQGRTKHAVDFFNDLGYIMPQNCNPADFFMNTISKCHVEDQEMAKILNKYELEAVGPRTASWLMKHSKCSKYLQLQRDFKQIRWINQVFLLFVRFLFEDMWNIRESLTSTGFFLITCIVTGIMYSGIDFLQQSAVQDVAGALYTYSSELLLTISYTVTMTFPNAMPLLRREVGEGTYSLSAYYAATVLSFIPTSFLKSYIFLAIFYLMLFANRGFLLFWSMGLVLSIAGIASTSYGLFLSSIFQSDIMAYECAVPLDLVFLIFSGVYINVDTIPLVKYVSIFFYTNEALLYKFWRDVSFIACPTNEAHPCLQNGIEVLKNSSLRTADNTFFLDCIGLLTIALLFHLVTFFFIRKYVNRCGFY